VTLLRLSQYSSFRRPTVLSEPHLVLVDLCTHSQEWGFALNQETGRSCFKSTRALLPSLCLYHAAKNEGASLVNRLTNGWQRSRTDAHGQGKNKME